MNRIAHAASFMMAGALLSGCDSHENAFTLYRGSPADPQGRVHVATFDAAERAEYNSTNCLLAEKLYRQQPGVTVRYWCEKGRFRK